MLKEMMHTMYIPFCTTVHESRFVSGRSTAVTTIPVPISIHATIRVILARRRERALAALTSFAVVYALLMTK